jgi:hypothetical protein
MECKEGELGNYNPYTKRYEHIMTSEERAEEIQKEQE